MAEFGTWRPIETAPRDGTSILIGAPGYPPMQAEWADHEPFGGYWRCGRPGAKGYDDPGSMEPIAWMPLPPPPPVAKPDCRHMYTFENGTGVTTCRDCGHSE